MNEVEHQRKYFSREGHLFNLHKNVTDEVCAKRVGPYIRVSLGIYLFITQIVMYSASHRWGNFDLVGNCFSGWTASLIYTYRNLTYFHFDYTISDVVNFGFEMQIMFLTTWYGSKIYYFICQIFWVSLYVCIVLALSAYEAKYDKDFVHH